MTRNLPPSVGEVVVDAGQRANLMWLIVAGVFSGVWALVTVVITERRANNDWVLQLFAELRAIDELIIAHPELQAYLSTSYDKPREYFMVSGEVLHDEHFYRTKTLVYRQLNLFDSLLSRTRRDTWCRQVRLRLLFPHSAELSNWESYIEERLRHPLFRAILAEEQDIFGDSLQEFYAAHEAQINSQPPRQYLW